MRSGWLRQPQRATSGEMHTDLAATLRLSPSPVRALSQQCSCPLLACHARQQRDRLAQVAQEQGGFVMALDGLAPPGGEPHIWFIRDLSTDLPPQSKALEVSEVAVFTEEYVQTEVFS